MIKQIKTKKPIVRLQLVIKRPTLKKTIRKRIKIKKTTQIKLRKIILTKLKQMKVILRRAPITIKQLKKKLLLNPRIV